MLDALILNDEELYYQQALISSIDDIIISTDKNLIIKAWNATAERVYEITAEDAIGRKLPDIFYYEFVDSTSIKIQRKLAVRNYWKGTVKVTTENSKITFLRSVITVVKDAAQRRIGYVSISKDVTRDRSLKQLFRNVESMLTQLDESFLIVDRNYKIIFQRLKSNTQKFFTSNYQVGDSALKYIPDLYASFVKKSYQKAFTGKIVNYNAISAAKPKLYFNLTYAPLRDSMGNITNACVIIKDFTAQKEMEFMREQQNAAEKKLFESRKFFEDFMENSPLLAWIVDDGGSIHYMNSSYAEFFNINKNESISIFEIYSEQLAMEYFVNNARILQNGAPVETIENRFTACDKTFKIIKFPILYNNKTMIASWGVDISDQIAMQESLLLLNQNKNKIMSVIAHDVRGPLGINAGFIDSIIQDYESIEENELLKHLKMLKKGISKCYGLTEELLLWARNQLQTISFNPCELHAHDEIEKVLENMMYIADEKNISVETQFCKAGKIVADHDMFAIVVRNFVSNAIKFSKENSTVIVSTSIQNGKLLVSVKDTGIGIKKDLVKKLLNKLNYESSFGTKGEKGAGLGLIIAKDYIERNNGEMFIESEEGKGTTFSFTIDFATNDCLQ
ncbi:MAG: PAS domain S-box protein [Parafilimonas sp.]|nr:PAS domain S-box protein [Parafilimonas sp.]